MYSYPLRDLPHILASEREWSFAHGVCVNIVESGKAASVVPIAHTVLPSPFPKSCFDAAMDVALAFNHLYYAVANDDAFLQQHLESAAKTDDFTRNLLDIHRSVKSHQIQPIQCIVLRSDYMLHQVDDAPPQIKQVEINTISCSFSGLGPRIAKMHKFALREFRGVFAHAPPAQLEQHLLPNDADVGTAETLAAAWTQYGNKDAIVVFLVQPAERNKYDQLHLQYLLGERGVPVQRYTFEELNGHVSISDRGNLVVRNAHGSSFEVALVYFRAGYTPNDYKSEKDWATRRTIEMSRAVKVPTVPWQLAGAKKIQQVLFDERLLAKFVPDERTRAQLHACFIGMSAVADASIAKAVANPGGWVLKPQREGGGNNLYDDELKGALQRMSVDERDSYILMEKIQSKPFPSCVQRNTDTHEGLFVSELGIYTGLVMNAGTSVFDRRLGYLLRTKGASQNEAGVAAGFGALDSPFLI